MSISRFFTWKMKKRGVNIKPKIDTGTGDTSGRETAMYSSKLKEPLSAQTPIKDNSERKTLPNLQHAGASLIVSSNRNSSVKQKVLKILSPRASDVDVDT